MSTNLALHLNHVAVSVSDIDAAVKWYTEVLGFRQLKPKVTLKRAEEPNGIIFRIYGSKLHEVKVACLDTGNKVGFEIFEFVSPRYGGPTSTALFNEDSWTRGGFFHICLTAADPHGLAEKVIRAGGAQVGETVKLGNEETALYVQDPWSNVIEVASTDFESLIA